MAEGRDAFANEEPASPMPSQMTDQELKATLQAEKADCLSSYSSSELANQREKAMDYYLGDMNDDMPAIEGRSQAVSTDVADSVEGLMPWLMEIFCGGSDDVVRFDPVGPEDEEAAQQETDYVNYVLMQLNSGFLVLYTMIKDALLSKTGLAKVWWEKKENDQRETYYDQLPDVYMLIQADPRFEVTAHTEHDGLHDFTIITKKDESRCVIDPIPPEEFGISRHARGDLQEASYLFHEPANGKTERDLIAQGFDPEQIKSLPSYAQPQRNKSGEILARDTVLENVLAGSDEGFNQANRRIRVTEHYCWLDYEGDGKARRYRVTTGGEDSEVLRRKTDDGGYKSDIEEVEWWPIAAITPIVQTHRFFGRSIADVTMDIQRIKTALTRGLLDNIYFSMHPRPEVSISTSTPETLDDVMTWRPGAPIRVKSPGTVVWQTVPDMTGAVLPAVQYFDATREWRTGVTRQGQGIDANALQNQSATAAMQVYTAAQSRMRLIARTFAETGITDLFWLIHSTVRKYSSAQQTVQLRNKWVSVNPREWKERKDMTINVGLGRGSRAEESMVIQQMIGMMAQASQTGVLPVTPKNFYNAAQDFCRINKIPNVERYFPDPGDAPMPQPQPNPDMVKAQQQQQIEAAQAQADMATQQQKAQTEAALQQQKFELESRLRLQEHEMKMQESQHRLAVDAIKAANSGEAPIDMSALLAKIVPPSTPKRRRIKKVAPGEYIAEET
jgi:hypothetical protein